MERATASKYRERDWEERPVHRRTWVGGDSQSVDDNLPEWAVDSVAVAYGGTFDSLGAFHGYSNDDTYLPKTQETPYALTRSHTHGSLSRSKTTEEGSEDWWSSEKAKKLSPKRFNASDITFKKPNHVTSDLDYTSPISKEHENLEPPAATSEPSDTSARYVDEDCKKNVRFADSKTFDSLMRTDIKLELANDERGNFQSVMITPNNSLRQKHQNIVQCANNNATRYQKPGILQLLQKTQGAQHDSELPTQQPASEHKIVDDLMELALEENEHFSALPKMQLSDMTGTSAAAGTPSCMSDSVSQMSNVILQHRRISSPVHQGQGLVMTVRSGLPSPGIQSGGLQAPGVQSNVLPGVGLCSGLHGASLQGTAHFQGSGLKEAGLKCSELSSCGKQNASLQASASVAISNCTLNVSLGLPHGPSTNALSQAVGIPMSGVPPPVMPHHGIGDPGEGSSGLLAGGQNISCFPCGGLPGVSAANIVNSSLFIGQNTNTRSVQSSNQLQLNRNSQKMISVHGHSDAQAAFNSTVYSNMTQTPNSSSSDQWYYEDPGKIIQGPFSSKEMYSWYRAGFFSPCLMVRRACDAVMRPLGSYGPVVPFAQDHCFVQDHIMSSFPLASVFESRNQGTNESVLNSQPGLGLDVLNLSNTSSVDNMPFGLVGIVRNPPFGQQQTVESLWSQAPPSADLQWMQQGNACNESRFNSIPMLFWDQKTPALASNTLLPEGVSKKMKTEDEILAQLRAQSQSMGSLPYGDEQPPLPHLPPAASPAKTENGLLARASISSNIGDSNNKLTQEDSPKNPPLPPEPNMKSVAHLESSSPKLKQAAAEVKAKQIKHAQKVARNKDHTVKSKTNKKGNEDEREESAETKKEKAIRAGKNTEEHSTKGKKEDTINKKKLEKDELVMESNTIITTDKSIKDNKKKPEEIITAEEVERKRMEEERLVAEKEKKKPQSELYKKQQELAQEKQQRQVAESLTKKAPWSGVMAQVVILSKDQLTLAEIQRLEREHKLEQIKEQQQVVQLNAQHQAVALAREQAEAEKQTQAVEVLQSSEGIQITAPFSNNNVPWGSLQTDGGGFWDTLAPAVKLAQVEAAKTVEATRSQKKPSPTLRKEMSQVDEFDTWCSTVLSSWSAKIDVPTFMSFLKDIESPYEVKDYVRCYLGDSKDSNDFARQFLERRSKLLRVGMVTPSDDLCSPAVAINPRSVSSSDYQEVKSKGKKAKKNKMMKVDAARLLGFSVTAAEDRINIGDIDTV